MRTPVNELNGRSPAVTFSSRRARDPAGEAWPGQASRLLSRQLAMTKQKLSRGVLTAAMWPFLFLGLCGCGHGSLVPAPSAKVISGAPNAAFLEIAGVSCSADTGAWPERAAKPPDGVVPVKVRVRNQSGKPIRLLAEDFVLLGKSGQKYRPIPVLPLDAENPPRLTPVFASVKFYVAPRFRAAYPTLEPWSSGLERDQALYDRQFDRWGKRRPTLQMIRMALPEGVLEDGGLISGFLYFESPLEDEDRVTFQADFVPGEGSGTVASIEIPFRVR
jgi:hypothetical protein